MGMGLLITGICIAVILAITIMIIVVTEYGKMKWWKTALLLFLLGIISLVFIILGIWLGE